MSECVLGLMSEWALADTFPPIQLYITLAMTMALFGVIVNRTEVGKGGYVVIFLAFCAAISVVLSLVAAVAVKTTSGPESTYLVANAVVIAGLFGVMAGWWYKKVNEWPLPPTSS